MGKPIPGRYRFFVGLILTVALAFGAGWLVKDQGHTVSAQTAPAAPPAAADPIDPTAPVSSDYSQRVVAYIYGNMPITREELGEYLIARYGAEKLNLLINKRVIDHACREYGIEVTRAEIDAALDFDCKGIGVDRKRFVDQILKKYRKTLYEWKEDVIRPRLLLTKLCQHRIEITEEDMRKAFEHQYGEKVKCRIILYPRDQQRFLGQLYDKVRKSEKDFIEAAKKQPNPNLAMRAGLINPVSRHSGLDKIEQVAFSLKEGEVSHVIEVQEGYLIMKCDGREQANAKVQFEEVAEVLEKQVRDQKIQQEIPKVFKELLAKAAPKQFLVQKVTQQQMEKEVKELIQPGKP